MKLNNKKGFTLVELVIVIAVIAILAAVLIPTFSNIIESANENAAMQNARNTLTDYLSGNTNRLGEDYVIESGKYFFGAIDGSFNSAKLTKTANANEYSLEIDGKTYTFTQTGSQLNGSNDIKIYAATATANP